MAHREYKDFPIGTLVRAYDFEPMEGRAARYVDGIVTEHSETSCGAYALKLHVIADTAFPMGARLEIFAPLNTSMMDYEGRLEILKESEVA